MVRLTCKQYTDEDELRAMMGELSTKNDDNDSDTEAKQVTALSSFSHNQM